MSTTADRWFVPDEEFYRITNDDALVSRSASSVREDLAEVDDAAARVIRTNASFLTEYLHTHSERCYNFAVQGQLVYADVDNEDPAQKWKVDNWAKAKPFEDESSETQASKKEFLTWCVDHSLSDYPVEDDEGLDEEDQRNLRQRWVLEDLKQLTRQGFLQIPLVSHILMSKTVEEKQAILHIMSGQVQHPIKRPVLALIHMFDSRQTTEPGETAGWVIGYDFIKELLIIKPFHSNEHQHPLGAKWYGTVTDDGVSFCGTISEFAKAYIELGKAVKANNENDGFIMLVHTIAADWLNEFQYSLDAFGTTTRYDFRAVGGAMDIIKEAMEVMKFPSVQKHPRDKIEPFVRLLETIESEESAIRDAAVEAKGRGEKIVAGNAAKLYESLHQQIKAFNENPFY